MLESDSAETFIPSGSGFGFGGGMICTGCSTSRSFAGRGEIPVLLSGTERDSFSEDLFIDIPGC